MPRNTKTIIPDRCLQKESMQEQVGFLTVFTFTILLNNVVYIKQFEKGLFSVKYWASCQCTVHAEINPYNKRYIVHTQHKDGKSAQESECSI